jgi:hypothetical protein
LAAEFAKRQKLAIRMRGDLLFSVSCTGFYSNGLAIRIRLRPRLDPLAGVVDVGAGDDGVDDIAGGGLDSRDLLDDVAEDVAEIAAAARGKTGGVDVAIDG